MPRDGAETPSDCPPDGAATLPGTVRKVLPILNKRGLHARASAKFVQCVEQYDAEVLVSRAGETVGGASIMGLMMLAAGTGTSIIVEARGPEAEDVVAALQTLVEARFGEEG